MDRNRKAALLQELREKLGQAVIIITCHSTGLNSQRTRELRRAIRRAGGELKVAKNTIARIAVDGTPFAPLSRYLEGPTGLVFGYQDPVAVTKALVEFAREENQRLQVRAAVTSGELLDPAGVEALAKLPEKPVLLGQLLSLLQAPATALVRVMQEPAAQVVRLLNQRMEQLKTPD